jgi:heavy metal sensor kinase
MRLRPTHVRTRLTLWYVGVLASMLLLAWAATYALLFWQLRGQLDHFSVQEIETVEGLFFFTPDGVLHLREDYHNHAESREVIDRFLEVRSPSGAVLLRNDRLAGRALGEVPFAGEGVGGYSERSARLADGTRVRLVSRRHMLDGHALVIRLAHSEEPLYSRLRELLLASLLVLPLVLGIAGFAGHALARRALRPVGEMARRAQEITPDNLHARLPNDRNDDELGHLARVFNQTLDRLDQAFEQLRRFTSDASHELRTPLAMIRSVGEVGLQKDGTPAEYRDRIGSMLEELNRLTSLLDNLLTISRADSGHLQLRRGSVSVLELAREAAGLLEVLAEERGQNLIVEGDAEIRADVDRLILRHALVNVIHNAVKYSPADEKIFVRVFAAGGEVTIEVDDNGPGIPVEDRSRVFDRFYRVDKARSRETGGAGLGLAIAKWAVEAHGGAITLDCGASVGCRFQIHLPRPPAVSDLGRAFAPSLTESV